VPSDRSRLPQILPCGPVLSWQRRRQQSLRPTWLSRPMPGWEQEQSCFSSTGTQAPSTSKTHSLKAGGRILTPALPHAALTAAPVQVQRVEPTKAFADDSATLVEDDQSVHQVLQALDLNAAAGGPRASVAKSVTLPLGPPQQLQQQRPAQLTGWRHLRDAWAATATRPCSLPCAAQCQLAGGPGGGPATWALSSCAACRAGGDLHQLTPSYPPPLDLHPPRLHLSPLDLRPVVSLTLARLPHKAGPRWVGRCLALQRSYPAFMWAPAPCVAL
jgi:hypothetical protein